MWLCGILLVVSKLQRTLCVLITMFYLRSVLPPCTVTAAHCTFIISWMLNILYISLVLGVSYHVPSVHSQHTNITPTRLCLMCFWSCQNKTASRSKQLMHIIFPVWHRTVFFPIFSRSESKHSLSLAYIFFNIPMKWEREEEMDEVNYFIYILNAVKSPKVSFKLWIRE